MTSHSECPDHPERTIRFKDALYGTDQGAVCMDCDWKSPPMQTTIDGREVAEPLEPEHQRTEQDALFTADPQIKSQTGLKL